MSVELTPFNITDLAYLNIREPFREVLDVDAKVVFDAYSGPYSYSVWSPSGALLLCAGILVDRAVAWALPAADIGRYAVPVARSVLRHGLKPYVRDFNSPVYTGIDLNDGFAVRWAELLGMRPTRNPELWVYDADAL